MNAIDINNDLEMRETLSRIVNVYARTDLPPSPVPLLAAMIVWRSILAQMLEGAEFDAVLNYVITVQGERRYGANMTERKGQTTASSCSEMCD